MGAGLLTAACAFVACSSDGDSGVESPAPAQDAGAEDATYEWGWEASPPQPDAETVVQCTIDNGGDPVGLCVQKFVLTTQHDAAFRAGAGMASRWDATTYVPATDDAGAVLHDPRDDAAYAAAMARYHASAKRYGDTEMTWQFDADLVALLPVVKAGFATPGEACTGESYRHLRQMAGGLRTINKAEEADAIDALADGCGREIYEHRYHELPAGVADSDAGALDGSVDGAFDSGSAEPRGIIGWESSSGAYEYEPAEVAFCALALVDMAWRHLDDDPGLAEPLQRAAMRSVSYAWERGRHSSGLLHRRLRTSSGLADEVVGETPGVLLSEVQGAFALSLLRALELIEESQKGPETDAGPKGLVVAAQFPWLERAEGLLEAVNGPEGLWDDEHGGFLEGWEPSSSQRFEAKLVRANGFLLAGIHRWSKVGSSAYGARIKELRKLMLERFAEHTSLLTSAPNQRAYFEAVPRDYAIVDGSDPRWTSYSGLANTSGCESLDDGWFGLAD